MTPIFSEFAGASVAPPAGFEPATYGLEVRRSIQLSYGGKHADRPQPPPTPAP